LIFFDRAEWQGDGCAAAASTVPLCLTLGACAANPDSDAGGGSRGWDDEGVLGGGGVRAGGRLCRAGDGAWRHRRHASCRRRAATGVPLALGRVAALRRRASLRRGA